MSDLNEDDGPSPRRPEDSAVLCVDDEPRVLSALGRTLAREPYELFRAGSGGEALDLLEHLPVKVVVADERMPGMSGSRLLAEVGRRWPLVGRIILTGYPGRDAVLRGLEAQVDFLIYKPWDDEMLRRAVRRLLIEVNRAKERDSGEEADPWLDLGAPG